MYKTDFAGIDLTQTWLDQAINLDTAVNFFSQHLQTQLWDKGTLPLRGLATSKFVDATSQFFFLTFYYYYMQPFIRCALCGTSGVVPKKEVHPR